MLATAIAASSQNTTTARTNRPRRPQWRRPPALPAWLKASLRPVRRRQRLAGRRFPSVTAANRWREKSRRQAAADRLRCRDQFEPVDQRQGDAGKGDEDGGRYHQRTLRRRAVPISAPAGVWAMIPASGGHRHHDADRGLVPFLFGQQVDREIGAEAVAHVCEKEIQRIQRPLDAWFLAIDQINPTRCLCPRWQLCSTGSVSRRVGQRRDCAVPTISVEVMQRVGKLRFAHPTTYLPIRCSLKYFSAPGWNGIGETLLHLVVERKALGFPCARRRYRPSSPPAS